MLGRVHRIPVEANKREDPVTSVVRTAGVGEGGTHEH